MFHSARGLVVALVAVSGLAFAGESAQAQSFDHIDRLALELRGQASQLYWEFRSHYRHFAHANHLMADASNLYRKADHLHDVAHTGSLNHMRSDLADIDRLFHHLEDLVRDIHFDAHDFHHGHGGHIHGNTRHVRRLMNEMEDTIHHLQDDLSRVQVGRPVYVPARPQVRVVPGNGGGISFGNGRVQFRVGF